MVIALVVVIVTIATIAFLLNSTTHKLFSSAGFCRSIHEFDSKISEQIVHLISCLELNVLLGPYTSEIKNGRISESKFDFNSSLLSILLSLQKHFSPLVSKSCKSNKLERGEFFLILGGTQDMINIRGNFS